MKHLKAHPFYRKSLLPDGFIQQLEKIADNRIRGLVEEIPGEWISRLKLAKHGALSKKVMAEKLIQKKQYGIALRARLDLLRVVKAETAEEEELKSLENRKAFEQKYGRL